MYMPVSHDFFMIFFLLKTNWSNLSFFSFKIHSVWELLCIFKMFLGIYFRQLPVIIPYLNLFPVSDIPWVCEAAYVWSLWVTTDPSGHTLSSAVFVEICHRWKVSVFVKYIIIEVLVDHFIVNLLNFNFISKCSQKSAPVYCLSTWDSNALNCNLYIEEHFKLHVLYKNFVMVVWFKFYWRR